MLSGHPSTTVVQGGIATAQSKQNEAVLSANRCPGLKWQLDAAPQRTALAVPRSGRGARNCRQHRGHRPPGGHRAACASEGGRRRTGQVYSAYQQST